MKRHWHRYRSLICFLLLHHWSRFTVLSTNHLHSAYPSALFSTPPIPRPYSPLPPIPRPYSPLPLSLVPILHSPYPSPLFSTPPIPRPYSPLPLSLAPILHSLPLPSNLSSHSPPISVSVFLFPFYPQLCGHPLSSSTIPFPPCSRDH